MVKVSSESSINYKRFLPYIFGFTTVIILLIAFSGNLSNSDSKISDAKDNNYSYTTEEFKETLGYSSLTQSYTYMDLKSCIKYWGLPDSAEATYETTVLNRTDLLRCSWNNVIVDGRIVEINFSIPDYYTTVNPGDFTDINNIDMELADAAKIFSYQIKRY